MSSRSFQLLVAASVASLAIAAWTIVGQQSASSGWVDVPQTLFPALDHEGTLVDAVTVQRGGYSISFSRAGDRWVASSLGGYPARSVVVHSVVADIAGLKPLEPKTANPEWHQLIGVDAPGPGSITKSVQLRNGATVLADLLVGRESKTLSADLIGGTFVRVPDDEHSWLARGLIEVPATLGDWFDGIINVPATDIVRVKIYENMSKVLEAEKDSATGTYRLIYADKARVGEDAILDDTQVKALASGIVSVVLEDVQPAEAVSAVAGSRLIELDTAQGMQVQVTITRGEGRPWVKFHATALPDGSDTARADAINARADGWAYRIGSAKTIALMTEISDLVIKPQADDAGVVPGQMFYDPSDIPGLAPQGN